MTEKPEDYFETMLARKCKGTVEATTSDGKVIKLEIAEKGRECRVSIDGKTVDNCTRAMVSLRAEGPTTMYAEFFKVKDGKSEPQQ